MNKKLAFSIILIIIWCIVIFSFSAMTSNESNNRSKGTIDKITEKTLKLTNKIGITDKHPSN